MARFRVIGALAGLFALSGCFTELEGRADPDLGDDAALRLGRIHVLLDHADVDADVDPDRFTSFVEVAARFAYFRGFDEEFVRARADVPVVATDILRPGQCVPTDQLQVEDSDPETGDGRELVLVDAGDLAVEIGSTRFSVPVSLVPDLLPYMSGVEYLFLSDATAEPEVELPRSIVPIRIVAEGAQAEDLADFTVDGQVPAPLFVSGELSGGALDLRWSATDAGSEPIVVTIATPGDVLGSDVTCVFVDDGSAVVDIGMLQLQGVDPTVADALTIRASRLHRRTFDAGSFAGVELLVETRDTFSLASR